VAARGEVMEEASAEPLATEPMPVPQATVPTPAPAPEPAPIPAPRRAASALRSTSPSDRVIAPPRAETEARMLARALAQLRQQHDPPAALATLDRLAQTFPGGVLAPEALATRIEAALAMNDLTTATKLVETTTPPPGRAGAALLVVRAELRARAGRCDAATRDFARVLDTTSTGASVGDLHERALYGRGVCLGHLGQAAGARRDLAAYLRDHPNGRFSAEARRLLDQTP
jgi:hypothetical protein